MYFYPRHNISGFGIKVTHLWLKNISSPYKKEFCDLLISKSCSIFFNSNIYGWEWVLVPECFVDIQKDPPAISLDKQKTVHNDREYMQRTTLSWFICCEWKDRSTSFEKLSDVKESQPLQIAKYAVAMGVDHEPGFNWWVK